MKPSEVAARKWLDDECDFGWFSDNEYDTEAMMSLARELDRFAGERVLAERERCAKVALDHHVAIDGAPSACQRHRADVECGVLIAAAIRSAPGGGEGVAP